MNLIVNGLTALGFEGKMVSFCADIIAAFGILVFAGLAYIIVKRFVMKGIISLVRQTSTDWDDILLREGFFQRSSHLAPALVIYFMAPLSFVGHESVVAAVQGAASIYMLIDGLLMADSLLDAGVGICSSRDLPYRASVRGFVQAFKIILYIVVGVVILSTIAG